MVLFYILNLLWMAYHLFFSGSIGIGVVLVDIPVLIYQGTLTLLASSLEPYLSAAGGILLIGLGLSILEIKRIKVANLLPAIIIPSIILAII